METAKMSYKSVFRISLLLFALSATLHRVAGTTVPLDLQNHRNSPSHRSSWPSWFHRRQESSPSHSSRERHERDGNNRVHGRHEAQRGSRAPAGARVLHDALLRNSPSRNEAQTREARRNFYEGRSTFERAENESSGQSGIDRSSSGLEGSSGVGERELYESRTARSLPLPLPSTTTTPSMTTTTTPTTTTTRRRRTSNDLGEGSSDNESEKLTAVAVAEYSGTRAVAYAGYHHHRHNLDYNPTRNRESLTPGYGIVETATPSYTKHHAGRRVCTRQEPTSIAHHHRSRQYRLVYTELSSSTFLCCPGWSQVSRTSYGCNRPTCAAPCLNGGVCGPHGKCNCPKGYTGTQCQTDVDECVTEKPCGQLCTNVPGSYECHCRYGFHLQPDGQSCRKNGSDGTAFEARDLENDYGYTTSTTTETTRRTTPASHDTENEVGEGDLDQDYEIILKRLAKLEKQIARGRKREIEASEMSTKITQAVEGAMRRAVDNVQLMQQEIYDMRGKVKQFELESRKLQYLTNRVADLENRLRLRCRTATNG